ncbi:hypothetical protein [Rickettsia asembonensis]|uniref:hypothetical protein n=1 Tax=Rickettsia asembonensis TaxID=1068590 RepID=UPI0011BAD5FA|nr:hypothetical protein [Rickettsia asembonensis]
MLHGYLIVIARSEVTRQSRKIIKKFCKSDFFFLASSNYYVILLSSDRKAGPRGNTGLTYKSSLKRGYARSLFSK